ncbi:MAG TPA: TadE/TadG family type IV pilus assembly protein [Verrucomicrobiae bacterium]|jgi:Flp pilus assembly protein TadG|nr:TadE/TadG family type IV pilus assembly protein [Verrucomicrobiae bacterium]
MAARYVAQRGSTTVEFAIVASVIFFLIFGIVDFGFAVYMTHLVTDVSRMGARYAMVRGSTCKSSGCPATSTSIQSYVRSMSPIADPTAMMVTTTWSPGYGCVTSPYQAPGCTVSVQVQYPYHFAGAFLNGLVMPIASASQNTISQ